MATTIDLTDQRALRSVLGRFPSGVCVVTGRDPEGRTVGLACQSFMGVSLDPPLVLISVMKTSRTLPHLKDGAGFAVSVLGEGDEAVSTMAGSKAADKFEQIELTTTTSGHQVLTGAPAWFACELEAWVDAGDHVLLIGRVLEAGPADSDRGPLLFHNGRYASLGAEPAAGTKEPAAGAAEPASGAAGTAAGAAKPAGAAETDDLSGLLALMGPGTWL